MCAHNNFQGLKVQEVFLTKVYEINPRIRLRIMRSLMRVLNTEKIIFNTKGVHTNKKAKI